MKRTDILRTYGPGYELIEKSEIARAAGQALDLDKKVTERGVLYITSLGQWPPHFYANHMNVVLWTEGENDSRVHSNTPVEFIIINGEGTIESTSGRRSYKKGDRLTVPSGIYYCFIASKDTLALCLSSEPIYM